MVGLSILFPLYYLSVRLKLLRCAKIYDFHIGVVSLCANYVLRLE